MPGISTLAAMTLLTELYDISRFLSLDKFASYAGLVPDIKSNVETEHTAGMTYRRNATLRMVFIEASCVAVRKDPALTKAFNKFSLRIKKTKAIVHIARKLLTASASFL